MPDRFATAYVDRDPRAASFVPLRYDDTEHRAAAVAAAAERSVSDGVQHCLHSLNRNLTPSPARDAHLAALARPGTVCVVTGQQVGLFLGPLYTVYKAAAAIVTARALEAETGRTAVPIFWLQSEDHDFDEVATTYVPQSGGDEPLALTAAATALDRVSMAHRTFGDDVCDVRRRLAEALGTLPHATDVLDAIDRHYRPEVRWVDAFAGWLGELFAEQGLLLFDPRAPEVAPLAAPVHRRALTDAAPLADMLIARARSVTDAGFSAPVHIRDAAPLCFFHPDGAETPRFRMTPSGDAYDLVGADRAVSRDAVCQALETAPRCFSTSALLRPILQDTLLPTAAYVGGPGEIDYFAQLQPAYDLFALPMPLLVPRARFAVVEPKVRRGLDTLGLEIEALAGPEHELLENVAQRPAHLVAPEALQERLLTGLRSEIAALSPQLESLQPGLQKAAEKTVDSVERACGKFVDKYKSALNQADTRRVETVRRLKASLFPLDAPQERIYSLPYFAARHGAKAFVDRVIDHCRPFHPALEALEP